MIRRAGGGKMLSGDGRRKRVGDRRRGGGRLIVTERRCLRKYGMFLLDDGILWDDSISCYSRCSSMWYSSGMRRWRDSIWGVINLLMRIRCCML